MTNRKEIKIYSKNNTDDGKDGDILDNDDDNNDTDGNCKRGDCPLWIWNIMTCC